MSVSVCTQWSTQEINSLEINWWSLKLCVHGASKPWRRDDCHVLGNIYLIFIWSSTGAYVFCRTRYKIGTNITTSFVKWRKRINSISKAVCALINYIEELSPTRAHRKHWHSTRWWQSEKHWTPSTFCQFESIYATDAYYFCVQIQRILNIPIHMRGYGDSTYMVRCSLHMHRTKLLCVVKEYASLARKWKWKCGRGSVCACVSSRIRELL